MSSIERPLTGPHLVFDLTTALKELRAEEAYVRSGRAGRTLAKQGPLRLTLVALAAGASVETHHADAPMTLKPVTGRIRYRVGTESFELGATEVLFFGPGHAQDIRALEDSALLLTITQPDGARNEGI